MRIYIFIVLFLFLSRVAYSQEKIVIVYVDPSEQTTTYSLSNKLYDAVQETESKVLIYISNGKNPIVGTSIYDMQSISSALSGLKPVKNDVVFDLDSINRILNKENLLSDIAQREPNVANDEVLFFFFFDIKKCRDDKQIERIAERLILSNRLMNKQGLWPGCKVRVYLTGLQSDEDRMYLNQLKETSTYTIVEY